MSDTYRLGEWTIRVSRARGFLRRRHEGFFREALRRDSKGARKLCFQFTLFKGKESDEAIVQVRIFKDGSVQSWVYEPCMVRVFYWKKLIVLGVFEPKEPWQ